MIEIKVPALGESVTEATVAQWFKQVGEAIAQDEPLVELETDKVAVEVPAPAAGVLGQIAAEVGVAVEVGGLLGAIDETQTAAAAPVAAAQAVAAPIAAVSVAVPILETAAVPVAAVAAAAPAPVPSNVTTLSTAAASMPATAPVTMPLSPAVRRMVEEHGINAAAIPATGKDGRLLKEDVQRFLDGAAAVVAAQPQPAAPAVATAPAVPRPAPAPAPVGPRPHAAREEMVRMTRLRKRIAERLKEAQNTAAMLTTFNEVDMTALMAARRTYRDSFEKKHGVRLGFMSFFVRACVLALKEIPAVNAEVDGDNLIYKNYYNIGVAVGTPQGLVVPVLKDADTMGFAEIERSITDFGRRARDGKLTIDEMQGGTFTISNGGVYGSLMSMPILNPPQSAILGMHKIQERPMVVDGEVKPRSMMYLALSYDHRIIDGREAVTFLVRVKDCIESPERILLDV